MADFYLVPPDTVYVITCRCDCGVYSLGADDMIVNTLSLPRGVITSQKKK